MGGHWRRSTEIRARVLPSHDMNFLKRLVTESNRLNDPLEREVDQDSFCKTLLP